MPLNYSYVNVSSLEYYKIKPDVEYILTKMSGENYTKDSFYRDDPIFYSIIYKDSEPYEASTVITRPLFNGGCRVLNRLMVIPDKRDKVPSAKIPATTLTMLREQIKYVKDIYDFAFISREFNTHLFCKRFAKDASKFLKKDWFYEKEKYVVCREYKQKPCNQFIAWTSLLNTELGLLSSPFEQQLL